MAETFTGRCTGGPKAGEHLSAPSNSVPVIAPGRDTEGQLIGFYEHGDDGWIWRPEPVPSDDDRTR